MCFLDEYAPGDNVEIVGEVADAELGVEEVEITVIDPTGEEFVSSADAELNNDFEFEYDFDLDDAFHGRYAIIIEYDNVGADFSVFGVEQDGDSSSITASLSRSSYVQGDEVEITGEVEEIEPGDDIVITVEDPDGAEIFNDAVEPGTDRLFAFSFDLDEDAATGTYEVTIQYIASENQKVLTFTVSTNNPGNINLDMSEIDMVYEPGDDVTISGSIDDIESNVTEVTLVITKPGEPDEHETAQLSDNAEFAFTYEIENSASDGIYGIEVGYANENAVTYFLIDEETDDILVEPDDDHYRIGSNAEILGEIEDPQTGENEVRITVLDPNGEAPVNEDSVEIDSGGAFIYEFDIGNDDQAIGRYAVTVIYDSNHTGYAIFEVSS